jgi:hypothetical protein
MRPLLHLVSFALMLPGFIFASGFIVFGHAIAGGTLSEFFMRLLSGAAWLLNWGIFAAGTFLTVVLVGGFFARTRWLAALGVAILSIASAIVLIALGSQPFSSGRWLFLLPGIASFCISGWLARDQRSPAPVNFVG